MATEILILGRLLRGPRHGYEIRQALERSLGGLVRMTNSQIYPTLQSLEEMGALERSVERQEGRPDRHRYAITPRGHAILHDMVCDLPEAKARRDVEFYVRVAFFRLLSPEERLRLLQTRRQVLLARRENVATWGERGAVEPEDFLADLGALRAEMFDVELRWLDRWMGRAEAAGGPDPVEPLRPSREGGETT